MTGRDLRVGLVRVDEVLFHPHNVRTDLGDLRTLTNSIKQFGVMQPVVVEQYGKQMRLRAGHRRVAAARLAGLTRIPAVIHAEPLDDDEWIVQSVQENVMRRNLDRDDRQRAVQALRDLGCTWDGIGEAFAVAASTAMKWASGRHHSDSRGTEVRDRKNAARRAVRRLITTHQDEYEQLVQEELHRIPEPAAPERKPRHRWIKPAELVADVEHLLAAGESTRQICERLNTNGPTLGRRLYRAGRTDLGTLFYRVEAAA